jgi:hypothetical protein
MPDILPLREMDLDTRNWYQEQYQAAKRMEVLGIACKDVISILCGDGNPDPVARLQGLQQSVLFKRLAEGNFDLQIYMVNPFSGFAQARTQEERNDNCRSDILASIEALEWLDESVRGNKGPAIKGSVEVFVVEDNPYVSLTRVKRLNGTQAILVGFLVPGRLADRYPKLLFAEESGQFYELFAMAEHAFARNPVLVFSWNKDGPKFERKFSKPAGYDVFLCYNSIDKVQVSALRDRLRGKGILAWMDRWELEPGDGWVANLEKILAKVPCAAVCVGATRLGPWQTMELNYLFDQQARGRTRLIPVVLDDVEGNPGTSGFLGLFQWIDLRNKGAFEDLTEMIQRASRKM